jgi:hypothetical protein
MEREPTGVRRADALPLVVDISTGNYSMAGSCAATVASGLEPQDAIDRSVVTRVRVSVLRPDQRHREPVPARHHRLQGPA